MPDSSHLWDFFLIHAGPDEPSAVELYELLRMQHRVFLDQARIKPGDVCWKKLDAALKSSRIFVVLVSPQLQQAHYARDEILAAIDLSRRQPDRRRVVPIFLDPREQCENAMVHYGLRPFQAVDLAVAGEMPDVAKRLSCIARSLVAQAPLTNRERLVRRADDYMRACLGEPLSLLDLCRELGVSERTLHYAFQEVRGLSPIAYFRAFRLNAVRQELKTAPDTATVHEIAQRWGFWHTGEFAAAYRRLFGELPSQTLNGWPMGRFREGHRSLGRE